MGSPLTKESMTALLYEVIDEINKQLPVEKRLEKTEDTALFAEGGKLDSLGLVNLIVGVEQKVQEQFGVSISLADGDQTGETEGPFQSIGSLVDYVFALLKGKVGE